MGKTLYRKHNDTWLQQLRKHPNWNQDNIIELKGYSMAKQLMFIYSNEMEKCEAECFAINLRVKDSLFIVQVKDDPQAERRSDKESFLVVRYPREGEVVKGMYAGYFSQSELIAIGRKAVV